MTNQISILTSYLPIRSTQAFGVDFDKEMIRILQFGKKGRHYQVNGWGMKKIPKGVVSGYEIQEKEKFHDTFLDCIEESQGKIKGKDIVVSLPESKIFTRIISIPLMAEEEAHEPVKWETISNMPISIEEVYFDWYIVEKGTSTMKVLVMACPRKVVDNYIDVFESIGYNVVAFEAESLATGRSIIPDKRDEPILIVDFDTEDTSYAVYLDDYPIFTSSGTISEKMIKDAVAKSLGISHDQAEVQLIKYGIATNKEDRHETDPILEPFMYSLVTELERTIDFIQQKFNPQQKKIDKIVVSGVGSHIKGLPAYLSMKMQKEVVMANPWQNVDLGHNTPPLSLEESQQFSTVIGLAIRAKNNEDYH